MPLKLKVKICSTVVRQVLMYGLETWALRQNDEVQLMRTKMRLLRWIMGMSYRLANDKIREMAGLVKIAEVIRVR